VEFLGSQTVLEQYRQLGLLDPPQIGLLPDSQPVPENSLPEVQASQQSSELQVSPLQMALAAAALSWQGKQPVPQLASAYQDPETGWERLQAPPDSRQVIPPGQAERAAESMALGDVPAWQSLALAAGEGGQNQTWYLGGTLPDWSGAPLALAVLLEEENPAMAELIGQGLLTAAMRLR
jgi:hypothetical protein